MSHDLSWTNLGILPSLRGIHILVIEDNFCLLDPLLRIHPGPICTMGKYVYRFPNLLFCALSSFFLMYTGPSCSLPFFGLVHVYV